MTSTLPTSWPATAPLAQATAGAPSALPPDRAPPAGLPCCAAVARIWRSADLLGSHHEIQIDHHGAIYRLRVTALGKLILTK